MLKRIKRFAFSLAEVMVVLAIVTAVVAVSIKITKSRFDSVNRYLYYTAYSTLKTLVAEVHLKINSETNIDPVTGEPLPYNEAAPIWDGTETGKNLCLEIAGFANLTASGELCNAGATKATVDGIANLPEPYFGDITPSLILRNGMRLYSLTETESPSILNDFTIYNEDGSESEALSNNARKAYLVYVDIDGERNDSTLWEDIFPFYITLNGYVIPAYKDGGFGGANNIVDMATSIEYDDVNPSNGNVNSRWLAKNITFQDAACRSGFVNASGYCSGRTTDSICQKAADKYANCRVRVIAPIKIF